MVQPENLVRICSTLMEVFRILQSNWLQSFGRTKIRLDVEWKNLHNDRLLLPNAWERVVTQQRNRRKSMQGPRYILTLWEHIIWKNLWWG